MIRAQTSQRRLAFAPLGMTIAIAIVIASLVFVIAPTEPAATVTIKWSTRREIKTAGYLIYRAENFASPFALITREMIPAINDPYLGGSYVFTDTTTRAGVTYYYQLEDVALDGAHTRQDPIAVIARANTPTILGQPIAKMIALCSGTLAGIFLLIEVTRWRAR